MNDKLQILLRLILFFFSLNTLQGCATIQGEIANQDAGVKFYCDRQPHKGKTVSATVVKNPEIDQKLTIIYWDPENDYFGEDWPPEKRCLEVSERFQSIYKRDRLKYITADVAGWAEEPFNVICAVQDKDNSCEEEDLLFTLEGSDDPNEVLEDLIAFRERPSSNKPLLRGESQPGTFKEGKRIYYDFESELKTTSTKSKQDREIEAF